MQNGHVLECGGIPPLWIAANPWLNAAGNTFTNAMIVTAGNYNYDDATAASVKFYRMVDWLV